MLSINRVDLTNHFNLFTKKVKNKKRKAEDLDAQNVLSQLTHIFSTEDPNQLNVQLEKFLTDRWAQVKGGQFAYTTNPQSEATKMCFAVAQYLRTTNGGNKKAYQYLIPSITCTFNSLDGDFDLDDLPLGECILSDDGKSLIPLEIFDYLQDDSEGVHILTYPFLEMENSSPGQLTAKEIKRLAAFNPYFNKLYTQYLKIQELKKDGTSDGHRLQNLANALRKGGAYKGSGTGTDAGPEAYAGVSQFLEFFNQLTQEEKIGLVSLPIPNTKLTLGQVLDTLKGNKTPIISCVEVNAGYIEDLLKQHPELFSNNTIITRNINEYHQLKEGLSKNTRGQECPNPCEYDVMLAFKATNKMDFIQLARGLLTSGKDQQAIISTLKRYKDEKNTYLSSPKSSAYYDLLVEIIDKNYRLLFKHLQPLLSNELTTHLLPLLHQAIQDNRLWLVRELVALDSTCLFKKLGGKSPLRLALSLNKTNWDLVNYLADEINNQQPPPTEDTCDMGYLLHRATKLNDKELIVKSLKPYVNFSWHNLSGEGNGFTALHYAIKHGDNDTVKQLILLGCQYHKQFNDQPSAFSYAVSQKNLQALAFMIENDKGQVSYTAAINQAIKEKDQDLVELLVQSNKSSLFVKEDFPLDKAANSSQWDLVEYLLGEILEYPDKSMLNKMDLGNVFFRAIKNKKFQLAKKCLLPSTDLSWHIMSGSSKGFTALHFLIQFKNYKLLEILLKRGVNLHVSYKDSLNIFAYAVDQKDIKALELFIQYDKKPLDYSKYIHQALNGGDEAVLMLLARANPVALVTKVDNETVLGNLIKKRDWELFNTLFNVLVAQPFDIKSKCLMGFILLLLVHLKKDDLALRLLENFPFQETCNYAEGENKGFTALHYAIENESPDLIDKLLRAGANPYVKYQKAMSAFEYVISKRNANSLTRILQNPPEQGILNIGLKNAVHFRDKPCIDCLLEKGADTRGVIEDLKDLGDEEFIQWINDFPQRNVIESSEASETSEASSTSSEEESSSSASVSLR